MVGDRSRTAILTGEAVIVTVGAGVFSAEVAGGDRMSREEAALTEEAFGHWKGS